MPYDLDLKASSGVAVPDGDLDVDWTMLYDTWGEYLVATRSLQP